MTALLTRILALKSVVVLALVLAAGSASAAAGANLLRNPDFADGLAGWGADTQAPSRVEADATVYQTAGQSVRITKERGSIIAAIAQDVPVKPNTTYTFAGFVKGRVNGGVAVLGGYMYDQEGKWLGHFPGVPMPELDQFTLLSTTFTTPATAVKLQVRFEIYGEGTSGTAWVDRLYFGEGAEIPEGFVHSSLGESKEPAGDGQNSQTTSAVSSTQPNLIRNGSFELGLVPWSIDANGGSRAGIGGWTPSFGHRVGAF